jgi:hypothetical protein
MKKLLLLLIIPIGLSFAANPLETIITETDDSVKVERTQKQPSKWYYGGNIGLNFWNDYFYLGIFPLAGYKVSPQFSVGAKIGYAYYSYNDTDFSSHNYGGSIFTRYRVIPQIYLHGEFAYWSYESQTFNVVNQQFETERTWVPFLLLGGGYAQMVSPNVWVFVEVLFDVIQDSNSPYENWDPFVSFGVGVGF